jgi:hypothetical protein
MEIVNNTGLVLAVPAIIKFQFMKPPKKAAIPVKTPRISATPIGRVVLYLKITLYVLSAI